MWKPKKQASKQEKIAKMINAQLLMAAASGEKWAILQIKDSQDSTVVIMERSLEESRNKAHIASKNFEYVPKFDQIARDYLSSSPFSTVTHLCSIFQCTPTQLNSWVLDNESFSLAIEKGKVEGEVKSRNILLSFALQPAKKINGNLMKLLANNVYGIREEDVSTVKVFRSNKDRDIEKEMISRGIPIPVIEGGDMGGI